MIQDLSTEFPVRMLCEMLEVSPSTYYYTPRGRDDLTLLAWIEDVVVRFPTYGYRRVTAQLRREGHPVNHKRVQRVMRENDLVAIVSRRRRTTNSRHRLPRFPNLLRGVQVTHPDQVWCADITYVRLQQGFVYLAIVLVSSDN